MRVSAMFDEAPPRPAVPVKPQPTSNTALALFTTHEIFTASKLDAMDLLNLKPVPIQTDAAEAQLSENRAQVKRVIRTLDDLRRKHVDPLNAEVKAVNAEAKRWTDPLSSWDEQAERVLIAYQHVKAQRKAASEAEADRLAQEAARQLAEARTDEEAEAASVQMMHAELAAPTVLTRGVKTDSGTSFKREDWDFKVVDPGQVPPAYLVVDEKKIRAAVKAGAREIPGVAIFISESIPVRLT